MRFVSLPGTLEYEAARELQLEAVEQRARGEIADTVYFLEHEPVITRGRGLQWTGVPRARHAPIAGPLPEGVAYFESERGGDLTYHGPGQLVIYPIVKLDGLGWGPRRDVAAYLRKLEGVLVAALAEARIAAEARPGATGIWTGAKKIASIGVAVRRWVTFHGAALNVVNDLGPFSAISPCGFAPEVMARIGPEASSASSWREAWEGRIERAFRSSPAQYPGPG